MEKKFYRINNDGIEQISEIDLFEMNKDNSSTYFVDIQAIQRQDASQVLKKLGLPDEICNNIITPEDHIQFEYFGDSLYGELAYFSPHTKQSDYAGIIIHKNILFGIHPRDEGILSALIKPNMKFTKAQKDKISAKFLLYVTILNVLSNYGKLIIAARERIEDLALDLDKRKEGSNVSPKVFLESKSKLSIFSRALEKLYFTLYFPPTKNVLDGDDTYEIYFDYLLKTMEIVKISLRQTEDRLESLNDHYQLLLQDRANKRLNLLTIIQAIFVPLTLVVGIYGMNFTNMPELTYEYGYFITLALMAVAASISLVFFKKNGWFG